MHPRDFKFIFNAVEWAPGVLEREIQEGRWDVVRMPPEMVLEQVHPDSVWASARSALDL